MRVYWHASVHLWTLRYCFAPVFLVSFSTHFFYTRRQHDGTRTLFAEKRERNITIYEFIYLDLDLTFQERVHKFHSCWTIGW